MIVILLIMPQIVLSRALVPLPNALTLPASSRWAFESFIGITGVGSDVAADICWQLPDQTREAMTIDEATDECRCMGTNVLRQESCNFPGNGKYYDEVIDKPKPVEPPPLRDPPPEPEIPPPPDQPEDQSDQVAMAEYFQELEAYQDETTAIQDAYKEEMRAYEAEADFYSSKMETYQKDLLDWQLKRTAAVDPAVSIIDAYHSEFGWTFVDKDNPDAFWTKILTAWTSTVVITLVLVLAVLLMVKRKDVI
jgi:hypothetical protein